MTTPEEQFTDVARRGQEAMTAAMQTWTENIQKLVGSMPTPGAVGAPSADAVVDNVFDFAEQLLSTQREFTKSLLAAATPTVTTPPPSGSANRS